MGRAIVCERRKRAGVGALVGCRGGRGARALAGHGQGPGHAHRRNHAKQEEKAATSQPYKPSGYEKFMTGLENSFVSPPSGVFPFFGSVYSGGGFTLGAGYRQFYAARSGLGSEGPVLDQELQADRGRNPHAVEQQWPLDGGHSRRVAGRAADRLLRDRPGLARRRPREFQDQADLLHRRSRASPVVVDAARRRSGVRRLQERRRLGCGARRSRRATTRHRRRDCSRTSSTFAAEATAAIDWRPSPGYSRKGGYYGVTVHDYADRDKTYSFRRLDGELIQHLPILRENWVLSFRGRVQSMLDDDDNVPYYLLPSLGSGSTLRGYSTGRFRDRHALLTSAEFRWIPSRLALDMALFYDAGKVSRRFEGSRLQRPQVRLGHRGPVPRTDVDADSTRDGPRIRRMASGHLEQRGVLTGRPFRSCAHRFSSVPRWRRRSPCRSSPACLSVAPVAQSRPKFYSDDPIAREPDTQDASKVQEWEIGLIADLTLNLFGKPGDPTPDVRAQNVNTIDEVPDSSWFTNRIYAKPLSIDELTRGPNTARRSGAGQVDHHPREDGWNGAGLHGARRGGQHLVSLDGRARLSRRRDRGDCRGHAPVLGARLQRARKLPDDDASRERRHRRQSDGAVARPPPAVSRRRTSSDVFARANKSAGWLVPRHGAARPRRAASSAASSTSARVPTIPTTSCRTSIAASCARCRCSARGRTSST